MKKVEVFSKKLNKSFIVSLDNSGSKAKSYTELYTGKADLEGQSLEIKNDWETWSNQGWNNWGAICV